MASTAKSGRGGTAKLSGWTIPNLISWSYSHTVGFTAFNDSGTAGHTTRFTGNSDANGSIEFHVASGRAGCDVQPGIITAFVLQTAGGVQTVSGTVAVTGISVNVPVGEYGMITATISWEQSGALTVT